MANILDTGKPSAWLAQQQAMCRSSGVMLFFGSGESGKTTFASAAVQSALRQQDVLDREFSAELMPLASASAFLSAWLSPSLIEELDRIELLSQSEFSENISHFLRSIGVDSNSVLRAVATAIADKEPACVEAFTLALATHAAEVYKGSNVAPLAALASSYFFKSDDNIHNGFIALREQPNDDKRTATDELARAGEFRSIMDSLGDSPVSVRHYAVAIERAERATCVVLEFANASLVISKELGIAVMERSDSLEGFVEWAVKSESDTLDITEVKTDKAVGAGSVKQAYATLKSVEKLLQSATEGEKRELKTAKADFEEIVSLGVQSPAVVAKLRSLVESMPLRTLHDILAVSGLYSYVLVSSPGFEVAVANLARWYGTVTGLFKTALLARTELKDEQMYRCFVYNDSLENTFANIRILTDKGDVRIYTRSSLLSLVFGGMLIFRVIHFSAIDKTAARSLQVESAIQSGGLDSQILNATQNLSDFAAQMGVLVVAELRDDFTAGADVSLARAKLGANSRFAVHITKPSNERSVQSYGLEERGADVGREVWVRTKAYFPEEESGTFTYAGITLRDVQLLAQGGENE